MSFILPHSFILMVTGHTLSSSHPNRPCLSRMKVRMSFWTFSFSVMELVRSCQCRGVYSPAAVLSKIPVQACEDFDQFAWEFGLRNETTSLPPTLELLPSSNISVLSTLMIRR